MNIEKKLIILACLCISGAQFGIYLILPALPDIATQYSVTVQMSALVMTVYFISFGVSLFTTCFLYSYYPISKWFMLYFGFFLAGSLIGGLTNTFEMLLLSRFFQGIGVGLGTAVGRILVAYILNEKHFIQANAFFSMYIALISIAGPFAGGYINAYYGVAGIMFFLAFFACIAVFIGLYLVGLIKNLIPASHSELQVLDVKNVTSLSFWKYGIYSALAIGTQAFLLGYYPYFLYENFDSSSVEAGQYLMLFSLSYLIGNVSLLYLNKKNDAKIINYLFASFFFCLILLILQKALAITSFLGVTILFSIYSFTAGYSFPFYYSKAVSNYMGRKEIAVAICSALQIFFSLLSTLLLLVWL